MSARECRWFSIGSKPQRNHNPVGLSRRVKGAVHGKRAAKKPVSNVRRELTAIIGMCGCFKNVRAKMISPSSTC